MDSAFKPNAIGENGSIVQVLDVKMRSQRKNCFVRAHLTLLRFDLTRTSSSLLGLHWLL